MEMIVAGAIILLTIFPNSAPEKIQKSLSLSPSPSAASEKIITQAPSPTSKPKAPTIHKVSSGETMDSIAKKYYGSSKFWTTLWNDNEFIEDPRIIRAGMELTIRPEEPEYADELNEKLATIYEEIINPSPIPSPTSTTNSTPTQAPAGEQRVLGVPGSFDEIYRQAGAAFGVPWEILYGLHHMETGGRDGAISSGYGTGAQGPLQFMPGTWAAYGIDGNGDGTIDINNAIDAIHGAANYVSKHGTIDQALRSYGGNVQLVLDYAKSRGYSQ